MSRKNEMTLITQSLLSSYAYIFDVDDDFRESAEEDFLRALNRERGETTKAQQAGIDFEGDVYALAEHGIAPSNAKTMTGVYKVAARISGAQTQVKLSRPITVGGHDFLVYGIADAVRAGEIFDVKFSTKSLGSSDFYGKYLHSPQHPAYFYCLPQAFRFTYLISDGVDLYEETYTPEWGLLEGYISYLMDYLKEADLWDLYCEKWRARDQ